MTFDLFPSISPLMIPILALMIPIVAIVGHYLRQAFNERQRHETIREFVRAGQPVPPELLAVEPQENEWHGALQDNELRGARRNGASPNRILVPAVINVSIGLGLMAMFTAMMPGVWLWSIGLLPLFVGLGLALFWAVERNHLAQQTQPPKP